MSTASHSPAEQESLSRLTGMEEEQIDFTDIPELTEIQFRRAVRPNQVRGRQGPFVPLCLDIDLAAWFESRANGDAWQIEVNQVLREFMNHQSANPTSCT